MLIDLDFPIGPVEVDVTAIRVKNLPDVCDERADARKTTESAISASVVMRLPRGMFSSIERRVASGFSSESSQRRYMGVMTSAGMTALTRTPRSARSRAHSLVKAFMAPWRRHIRRFHLAR